MSALDAMKRTCGVIPLLLCWAAPIVGEERPERLPYFTGPQLLVEKENSATPRSLESDSSNLTPTRKFATPASQHDNVSNSQPLSTPANAQEIVPPAPQPLESIWPAPPQEILSDDDLLKPFTAENTPAGEPPWLPPCLSVGTRANEQACGQALLAPYWDRTGTEVSAPPPTSPAPQSPWWDPVVRRPVFGQAALRVSIDPLIQGALVHSPFIQAAAADPRIRTTAIVEEDAAFDWRTFIESNYSNANEPVGNILTTGNNDSRFKDLNWSGDAGVRRRQRVWRRVGNLQSHRLPGQ